MRRKLEHFRAKMGAIRGVLEAIKEGELGDFNPEDFKRMERENDDFVRRKKQSRK